MAYFGRGDASACLRARSFFWALSVCLLAACDCSNSSATLIIVSPPNGSSITPGADLDPATPGVQVEVRVQANGMPAGENVLLLVNQDPFAPDLTAAQDTAPLEADRTATLTATLRAGTNTLLLCDENCHVRSGIVRVTVADACADISFVTPVPPTDDQPVRLGALDDTDGDACGEEFRTTVQVATSAGSGRTATLFVNGEPAAETTVSGSIARFDDVVLGNRGDRPNLLEVEVQTETASCRQAFPSDLFVDCDGASCDITLPDATRQYLNADDDTSAELGFQTDFEVTTSAEAVGQTVRLLVDGVEAATGTPTAVGADGVVLFGSVALDEGPHRVQAHCMDDAGNVTLSTPSNWIVDMTPCEVTVTTPAEGELYTDVDDLDAMTPGIQIAADGTASGDDCTAVRVGDCAALEDADLSGTDWTATASLPTTSGAFDFCAEVEDAAGNVGTTVVPIEIRTELPELAIVEPAGGAAFNTLGTGGRLPDGDTSTVACDTSFTVHCTEVGADVQIVRVSNDQVLATAPCDAMAGLPSPFVGQASFARVPLPSVNDGTAYGVVARQAVDGLLGQSIVLSVQADCDVPTLAVNRPTCPSVLRPSEPADDTDPATPGLQHTVRILNDNSPKPEVTLDILHVESGMSRTLTSSTPATGLFTEFLNVDFSAGGTFELTASATDNASNVGMTSVCEVVVADLPTLAINEPLDGADIGASTCTPAGGGVGLRVLAETDADVGSDATAQVGGGTAVTGTVTAGVVPTANIIDICVPVTDGLAQAVTATVTDASRGTSMATVTVDVDLTAPPSPVTGLLVDIPDPRGGTVDFTWTHVPDQRGGADVPFDHYEMRCASADITNEAEWNAAATDPRTITVVPSTAGTAMEMVGTFRTGVTLFCALRGVDAGGNLSPEPIASVEVTPPFRMQEVTAAGSVGMGNIIAPLGDVSGDGIADFLIGAGANTAYLYLGAAGAFDASPVVTLTGTGFFGDPATGIGDFNGDGIDDFAIGAAFANSLDGMVYVFYGRPSRADWQATPTIDVTLSACEADLCIAGTDRLAWSAGIAGDFDGDGMADLAIGSFRNGNNRVYVVLGDSSYGAGTTVDVPGAMVSDEPFGFTIQAPAEVVGAGATVTSVGDITGDGRAELVLGAPGSTSVGTGCPYGAPTTPVDTRTCGAIVLVRGQAYTAGMGLQAVPGAAISVLAQGLPGRFGSTVRAIGDYNGDGRVDVGVSEPTSPGIFHLFLQSGSTYSDASRVRFTNSLASSDSDFFGASFGEGFHAGLTAAARNIGRIDGDAMSDLLLGSAQTGTEPGTVSLFYGTNTPPNPSRRVNADVTLNPITSETTAPRRVSYIGDVNDDTYLDFAIGDLGPMGSAGRVWIVY